MILNKLSVIVNLSVNKSWRTLTVSNVAWIMWPYHVTWSLMFGYSDRRADLPLWLFLDISAWKRQKRRICCFLCSWHQLSFWVWALRRVRPCLKAVTIHFYQLCKCARDTSACQQTASCSFEGHGWWGVSRVGRKRVLCLWDHVVEWFISMWM